MVLSTRRGRPCASIRPLYAAVGLAVLACKLECCEAINFGIREICTEKVRSGDGPFCLIENLWRVTRLFSSAMLLCLPSDEVVKQRFAT